MPSILSKLVEIKPALKIVQAKLFRRGIQAAHRDPKPEKPVVCSLEVRAVN